MQILKALVLGEEERGQSQYQVMCFLLHADKTEFISADAMAKLRQVSFLYFGLYVFVSFMFMRMHRQFCIAREPLKSATLSIFRAHLRKSYHYIVSLERRACCV